MKKVIPAAEVITCEEIEHIRNISNEARAV